MRLKVGLLYKQCLLNVANGWPRLMLQLNFEGTNAVTLKVY